MNLVLTAVLENLRRLPKDTKGSATPILLLAIMVILGSSALVLDVSRILAVQSNLNSASELAVVAMTKNLHFMEDQEIYDIGLDVLSANLTSDSSFFYSPETVQNLTINVITDDISGEVTIESQTKVATYLLKIFHFFEEVTVSKTVRAYQVMPEAEIIIALDSSAQMGISGKLDNLNAWASEFVQAFDGHAKIADGVQFSVVPFGGDYINVAPHKSWVEEGTWPEDVPPDVPGTKSWDGDLEEERWCVDRRSGTAAETDITPDESPFPLVISISSVDDADTGLPHYSVTTTDDCPAQPVVPLTNSIAALSEGFTKITGVGDVTVGQGMVWAERSLSPSWQSSWQLGGDRPVPYDDPVVDKIILLVVGSETASSVDQIQLMSTTCTRLKSNGVNIYVIDYLSSLDLASELELCATSSGYYFNVTSSSELREAFWQIAKFLTIVKLND